MQAPPHRGILIGLAFCSALLGAAPADAFSLFGIHLWGARDDRDAFAVIDPLHYTVQLKVSGGEDDLERRLQSASSLWSDREAPASGNAGLLSKARGDYRRLLVALYAAGYYGPEISIRAAGQEVSDVQIGVEFPQNVPVVISVVAGPQFLFGATRIVNAPKPDPDPRADSLASIGFQTGEPARSGVINQASALSIERWRDLSYAKAAETGRDVIADHPTSRLDVSLTLDPGRAARYGPTTVTGSRRVDPGFIAFMADLPQGKRFDPADIDAGQQRLNRLGVFNSIRFEEAGEILPDGSLPMTVRVEDRKPRTIGFGGTVSTIDGVGIAAYWAHRNLFGRAERLRFDAGVDGLGGSLNPDDFDYNLGVTFTKPGVWTPDTDFITSLIGQRVNFDTYQERSVTASAGIIAAVRRPPDRRDPRQRLALPLRGRLRRPALHHLRRGRPRRLRSPRRAARRHPRLLSRRRGQPVLRGGVRQRRGARHAGRPHLPRLRPAGQSRARRPRQGRQLRRHRRSSESPPDLLFFAGGGGSIRGYAYRSIGVESLARPRRGPVRGRRQGAGRGLGRAALPDQPELGRRRLRRQRPRHPGRRPSRGDNDFRTGVGLGVRYFTSIGVLRADLATPVNPRPEDSPVALYIGIGQAF